MNESGWRCVGGVVFDCDGVLADTAHCWEEAFAGVAGELGLTLCQDQLSELRGAALFTAAQWMTRWSPRPVVLGRVLESLSTWLLRSLDAAELSPIEGVRELLADLQPIVPLAVASNSPRAVLLRTLARLEITHYFAVAVSADDVARPKPAPDPYLAACEALGVDPGLTFAIEDSQIGICSATAAGLAVIELAGPSAPGQAQAGQEHEGQARPGQALAGHDLAGHDLAGHDRVGQDRVGQDRAGGPRSTLRVTSLADQRIRPLIAGSALLDATPGNHLYSERDSGKLF